MNELAPSITHAQLRAAVDLGHGGPLSEYKIDSDGDGYTVTLMISKPSLGLREVPLPPPPVPPSASPRSFAAYGSTGFKPWYMTEILQKEKQQVEEFLRKLSTEYKVYELASLKPPYPFLHPTFYSFSFRDGAGQTHSFEYKIECSNHLDEKYQRLVEEFESFFESRRIFAKFYESLQNR